MPKTISREKVKWFLRQGLDDLMMRGEPSETEIATELERLKTVTKQERARVEEGDDVEERFEALEKRLLKLERARFG